jgi:hypothetical protein
MADDRYPDGFCGWHRWLEGNATGVPRLPELTEGWLDDIVVPVASDSRHPMLRPVMTASDPDWISSYQVTRPAGRQCWRLVCRGARGRRGCRLRPVLPLPAKYGFHP